MIDAHLETGAAATLLTAILDDPAGYGRIIRNTAGAFLEIIEDRDATEAQREVNEVNAGVYVFDAKQLREALAD